MLETAIKPQISSEAVPTQAKKILRWETNDRMGGKVPVWDTAKTAKDNVAMEIAAAANPEDESFNAALAYADASAGVTPDEAFGFGDIIDMVNPLQHLPVVGYLYREVTGDQIKPISRIIGGGIYGGGIGAAGGLVDTVVEYETGTDIAGNAMALVKDGKSPQFRSDVAKSIDVSGSSKAAQALADFKDNTNSMEELGTALSFADLGGHQTAQQTQPQQPQRIAMAHGRTAGTQAVDYYTAEDPIIYQPAKREQITKLIFDFPSLND